MELNAPVPVPKMEVVDEGTQYSENLKDYPAEGAEVRIATVETGS